MKQRLTHHWYHVRLLSGRWLSGLLPTTACKLSTTKQQHCLHIRIYNLKTYTLITFPIFCLFPSWSTLSWRTRTVHMITCSLSFTMSTGMPTVWAVESFLTGYNDESFTFNIYSSMVILQRYQDNYQPTSVTISLDVSTYTLC